MKVFGIMAVFSVSVLNICINKTNREVQKKWIRKNVSF